MASETAGQEELEAQFWTATGHLSPSGRPYLPGSIKNMLAK